MKLRDALKAAVERQVARCVPQQTQHATSAPEHATAYATPAQLRAATPRGCRVLHATADATSAQPASCIAARERALPHATGATVCLFRLSREQADTCHAQPWTDEEASTFVRRRAALLERGLGEVDADDLAGQLHLRDVEGDDRRRCVECRHLAGKASTGWECREPTASGFGPGLPLELVTISQRCPAFLSAETTTPARPEDGDQTLGANQPC